MLEIGDSAKGHDLVAHKANRLDQRNSKRRTRKMNKRKRKKEINKILLTQKEVPPQFQM